MATFYRAWLIPTRQVRCRRCGAWVRFVYLDTGKRLPLEADAKPLREEVGANQARFDVYAGEASHLWRCPQKKA